MTTYAKERQTCGACGARFRVKIVSSTNEFGSPDLDLRPSEMIRSTLDYWLIECPRCYYIADDITNAPSNALDIIKSPEYKEYLVKINMPHTANKFLRYSLLLADDTKMCGMSKLCAAWACDDENLTELAKKIRSDAADLLLKIRPFSDNEESIDVAIVLIDILRRAGRFKEALELIKQLKRFSVVTSNKDTRQVIDFQKKLCEARDQNCYTFSDAYEMGQ